MRRAQRAQRRRIYLGCEGESEQSYGTFLHQLIAQNGRLHIDACLLQPGGGDPLTLVQRAFYEIRRREREFGAKYALRAVLLDRDMWGINPDRDRQVQPIITAANIQLIWQRPSHEGLLLRHLPGCQQLHPPTPANALDRLKGHWPDYEKGATAQYLRQRLTLDHVKAACNAEPELRIFLNSIRYFQP